MRRLRAICITIPLLLLAACGGAKSTTTPIPSAGTLPLFATASPTPSAVASAIARASDTPSAPVQPVSATPTPLAVPAVATPSGTAPAVAKPPAAASVAATPPRASQPAATAQPSKAGRVADIPSSAPQQVIGASADGLTLLNLRTGKNDGFTRLVFDLSKQDGSAAPVPRTRLWMQGSTIIVAFGGVRDDVYAESLGGGEQNVNLGMVKSVYRIPARDDAAAAYGIAVSGTTHVTLSSATLPTRIIVDVADK